MAQKSLTIFFFFCCKNSLELHNAVVLLKDNKLIIRKKCKISRCD
jgi:hypothetical protein